MLIEGIILTVPDSYLPWMEGQWNILSVPPIADSTVNEAIMMVVFMKARPVHR